MGFDTVDDATADEDEDVDTEKISSSTKMEFLIPGAVSRLI